MAIHFPDLSHHKQVSLDGAVALITKATEGTSFVDPSYAGYRADATRRRIPFCAFHWLHAVDILGQARHAFSVVGRVPLMVDDEDPTDGLSVARTLAFVKAYRALGGTVTLEYLPRWFWSQHGSPDLRPLAAAGLSLVSSAYPSSGYSDNGVGWLPYGGVTPAIWQYTNARPFNGALVDFNAFKGSVEELRALFTGDSLTPPQEGNMLIRVNETGAIWTVDPPRLWRRYVGGPEFDTRWGGHWDQAVPQAEVEAGWWGRDTATLAGQGDPVSPAELAAVAAAAEAGAEAGAPTDEELAQAAFEGAQRAERE